MATTRDIRRRIRTVRNIQQITKALKMIAAARLQKAQSRAEAARPYAEAMFSVMGRLSHVGGEIEHPLLERREPVNIGVVLVTSDRGMAGSYNTNVIRRTLSLIEPHERDKVKLVTVGRKGRLFFTKRQYDIAAHFPMPSSEVSFAEAQQAGQTVRSLFENREVDVVHIVYTRFYSAIRQRVTEMQLLPFEYAGEEEAERPQDYIFEPEPAVLLDRLLPRYVDTQVYRALLESLASEHGARMTAMSSATSNAEDMIGQLTLQFNRARQAAITEELAEIVGGAEALK